MWLTKVAIWTALNDKSAQRNYNNIKFQGERDLERGEFKQAEISFSYLKEFIPPNTRDYAWVVNNLIFVKEQVAAIYRKQGCWTSEMRRWDDIIQLTREGTEGVPPNPTAHYFYGILAQERLGDYNVAITHLQTACNIRPWSKPYADALERAHSDRRKKEKIKILLSKSRKVQSFEGYQKKSDSKDSKQKPTLQ